VQLFTEEVVVTTGWDKNRLFLSVACFLTHFKIHILLQILLHNNNVTSRTLHTHCIVSRQNTLSNIMYFVIIAA